MAENTTEQEVPQWIKELTDDIYEHIADGDLPFEVARLIEQRVAQNPPLLPDVPWKVVASVDHPSDVPGERIIGFRCQIPEDLPMMTYEKMEWLRAMRFGRDSSAGK